MARIKNIQNYTQQQLKQEVERGGRFVYFPFTVSIVVMTFKRGSSIVFIPAGEGTFRHRAGYSAINLVMGWWGLPWGPIYTLGSMFTNMGGGKDVTAEVVSQLGLNAHQGYNVPGTPSYNANGSQQPGQEERPTYNIPGTGTPNEAPASGNPTYNIPGTGNAGQSQNSDPTYNIPQ